MMIFYGAIECIKYEYTIRSCFSIAQMHTSSHKHTQVESYEKAD